MGQQQLLLIILGVVIVGIAVGVGIAIFGSTSVSSNRDAIVNDLQNLGANAYQFKIRPGTLGGGGGSYTGYQIPRSLRPNANATYSTSAVSNKSITFLATSAVGYGTVAVVCDSTGSLSSYTYTSEFL
jgi:hypothetical protein